jgi:predicted XRE-type DNA-binding protein
VATDAKLRHVTREGDNIFLDLGFPAKEAKRLLRQADGRIDESIRLKKELMDEIARWMKDQKITQTAAARALRTSRPRVSDVVNHKVEKFSIDSLVTMLACIGKEVRLEVVSE